MFGGYGVEIANTKSRFIGNKGHRGGAIYILQRQCASPLYQGTTCINSRLINRNCVFVDNYASSSGGVMVLWYGVNCSNINCNFTQNQGMQAATSQISSPLSIIQFFVSLFSYHIGIIMTVLRYYNIDPPGLLESTDPHTYHCSYDLSIKY